MLSLRLFGLDDESSTLVGLFFGRGLESSRAVTSHRIKVSQQCDYKVTHVGDRFHVLSPSESMNNCSRRALPCRVDGGIRATHGRSAYI